MKTKPFEPVITSWSGLLTWNKAELKKAVSLFISIGKMNGGRITNDVAVNEETGNRFLIARAEDALARRVNSYAKVLRDNFFNPVYGKPAGVQPAHAIPGLVTYEWHPCVDINSDDPETLCTVPGIKSATAQAIIAYRKQNGNYTDPEQLLQVKGIKAPKLAAMKTRIYCGTAKPAMTRTDELITFMQQPTFRNYVASFAGAEDSFIWSTGTNEDPKLHVITELAKTLDDITKNKYGVARNLHYTRASRVLIDNASAEKAATLATENTVQADGGALLFDGEYEPFLAELLNAAKKSIHVMMFFMKYEAGNKYVVNTLVDLLIAAQVKGLDVKVILDRDADGSQVRSRSINQPAFDVLKKNSVPVLFDTEERMTHSKLVIVDGEHVVTGSHNWTAGSFLAYNDTSMYTASQELGNKFEKIFDDFWNLYEKATAENGTVATVPAGEPAADEFSDADASDDYKG